MQSNPQPPQGYIGTPEAAEMLSVHQETVRNYIKDKKIEGMKEYDQGSKRWRYWAKRESIEALAQTQEPQDIEATDQLARRAEDVLQRIADQEYVLNTRLDRMEERQIKVIENLEKAMEMLEEEREYLRKQREELGQGQGQEQQEERGFWGWLFGQSR